MKIIEDAIIAKNTAKSFVVKKGGHVCVSGESIVDFVVFNLDNQRERFDQARTRVNQNKIYISTGDVLYSKFNNIMMTITEDTYKGKHDLQFGMCSKSRFGQIWEMRGTETWDEQWGKQGIKKREDLPDHGCWENLATALKRYDIAPEDIPSPFNLFMSAEIVMPSGEIRLRIDRDRPKAGSPAHVTLRAEMNCVVAASACPEFGKAGKAKDIRIEILEP